MEDDLRWKMTSDGRQPLMEGRWQAGWQAGALLLTVERCGDLVKAQLADCVVCKVNYSAGRNW